MFSRQNRRNKWVNAKVADLKTYIGMIEYKVGNVLDVEVYGISLLEIKFVPKCKLEIDIWSLK